MYLSDSEGEEDIIEMYLEDSEDELVIKFSKNAHKKVTIDETKNQTFYISKDKYLLTPIQKLKNIINKV